MRQIKNLKHLLVAILSNLFYNFPSQNLKIIGVTGTKGKTTTATFVYQILKTAGIPTALITTTGGKIGNKEFDTGFHVTTPSSTELQKYIKQAVDDNIQWIVIETTSHGLDQHRLWGINFDIGIFTNIEYDHLDYHKTWEKYLLAKSKLINQLKKGGTVILNKDDRSYPYLLKIAQKKDIHIISYGIKDHKSDFVAQENGRSINGVDFQVQGKKGEKEQFFLGAVGSFNISNALAAIIAAKTVGVGRQYIKQALKKMPPLKGRMEILQKKPFIIIDFAHTAASLQAALDSLIPIKPNIHSKIITVFGCAGLRDKARRKMGQVSARLADLTVITAEDPRTESIEQISEEIAYWAKKGGAREVKDRNSKLDSHVYIKIPDREEAIKFALQIAQKNDIVYITGKGHETTMCFGTTEVPWSDQKTVAKLIS